MDKQKVSSVVREEKDNSADDGNVKRERAIEKRSRAEVMLVKVTQNAVEELQGFRVKEGLGCVLFRAVVARKTRNLALPSLENPVFVICNLIWVKPFTAVRVHGYQTSFF